MQHFIQFITSGVLWTPANITTAVWYDSADASTITESGGAVSQWNDKSGNGKNATQGTAAAQPITGASTMNGLNVINFTKGVTYMQTPNIITGLESSVFAVINKNAAGVFDIILGSEGGNYWGYIFSNFVKTYGSKQAIHAAPEFHELLISSTRNGAASALFINGTTKAVTSNNLLAGTVSAVNRIGGFSTYSLGGSIAEVITFTTALSTSDRQKIEGYLAWKWGLTASLPTNHPYKTKPPTA